MPTRSWLYAPLRAVHLALTAAVMPLGVWGYTQHVQATGGGVRLAIFCVGSLLALFVLTLDQADYPVTSLGAVRRTAPLVVNFALGFWNGELWCGLLAGQVGAAAHWTLTSLLASLALALAIAGVLGLRSDDPDLRKERGIVLGLVLPISVAAALVAVAVAWPLVSGLTASASLLGASLSWLVQTGSTTRAWMRQSVFSRRRETGEAQARTAAMLPWNGAVAVALVGVLAALAGVLLFTLS